MSFWNNHGDPCGIGPEIILKAFRSKPELMEDSIVFGSFEFSTNFYNIKFKMGFNMNKIESLGKTANQVISINLDPYPVNVEHIPCRKKPALSVSCAFMYVQAAIGNLHWKRKLHPIVTAPLNKEALHMAGYNYAGPRRRYSLNLLIGDS